MKLCLQVTLSLALLVLAVFVFKVVQKQCWDHKILFAPPSLDSWDPTARGEAARAAARKYGGKP